MSNGRARTLKPEILEDERTASLSHEAYRLFIGMLLVADDFGNLRANEKLLDAAVFWARETTTSVSDLTQETIDAGLVVPYTVRGQRYLAIRTWQRHQRIDRPSKPKVPGPEEADKSVAESSKSLEQQESQEHSRDTRETLARHSRMIRDSFALDRIGEERKGGEEIRASASPDPTPEPAKPKPAKRRPNVGPMPADFAPDAAWLDRVGVLPDLRPGLETKFRDLAAAKAWAYADWQAAWRNFINREVEFGKLVLYPAATAPRMPQERFSGQERLPGRVDPQNRATADPGGFGDSVPIDDGELADLFTGIVTTGVTHA